MGYHDVKVTELIGKTFHTVEKEKSDERLLFYGKKGESFIMYHDQDCCESVYLEDIGGDLKDLEGSPILKAEVATSEKPGSGETSQWTFYLLSTAKGSVTLRWYGESDYYSTDVSIIRMGDE